ncbi:MAG: DUF4433 domain-containing protein [Saprospirales bacterium]|nr:DUF4433 domain-containing protein [Saprospirales bacterium]
MPGSIPDKIWLYRITHRDNLPHILRHGLVTAGHAEADPDFVGIGDNTLISVRKDKPVPVPPYGNLSEYVPFYLGLTHPCYCRSKPATKGFRKGHRRRLYISFFIG